MYCRGNPIKYSDPSGYDGMTREELESLGDSGWRSLEITAAGVSALSDGPLPIGDAGAAVMLVDALMLKSFLLKSGIGLFPKTNLNPLMFAKKSKSSGKTRATNIPSWVDKAAKQEGESGKDVAKRLCDKKYGSGEYEKGAGSEYSKIQKYFDRADQ
jgi:hypothetical protein